MDAIEVMLTRRTYGRLVEPGPDAETLRRAFEAAIAAPDHKRLLPVQFRLLEGLTSRLTRAALWFWALYFGPPCVNRL